MFDAKAYLAIPNWLDAGGCKLPFIKAGRRHACWCYGETSYLSLTYPRKEGLLPYMAQEKKKASIVSPIVRGKEHEPVGVL